MTCSKPPSGLLISLVFPALDSEGFLPRVTWVLELLDLGMADRLGASLCRRPVFMPSAFLSNPKSDGPLGLLHF